jgi:hypothetical protein
MSPALLYCVLLPVLLSRGDCLWRALRQMVVRLPDGVANDIGSYVQFVKQV